MPDSTGVPASEPEAAVSGNFFSRLMGVYGSPGKTFKEIGRDPRPLVPVIALVVFGLIQGFFMMRFIDFESLPQGMGPQGPMPPEQAQAAAGFIKGMMVVSTGVGTLLVALIIAALFLLASKVMSVDNTFKAVFTVTVYVLLAIAIVQFVILALVFALKGGQRLTPQNMGSFLRSSLGAILAGLLGDNALPGFLMRLLNYVEFFAIWTIALLAIGYAAVSRKLAISTAAILLAVAYAVFAIIAAAIGPMGGGPAAG